MSSRRGFFLFAQKVLPSLLKSVDKSPHPPSLLVTGATAAVKGSSNFATFSAGKFALRALGQSLAREFGPQGVHVAHVIVDGVIDTPWAKEYTVNGGVEGGKLEPEAVSLYLSCSRVVLFQSEGVAADSMANLTYVDCGDLLAPAYAAQVGVYAGDRSTAFC